MAKSDDDCKENNTFSSKIYKFLIQDIDLWHNYYLFGLIFFVLFVIGYTSYSLFSYEIEQESNIRVVFSDINGPSCVIEGPNSSEIGINSSTTYIMNCTDSFGVASSTLTSDNFTITGDITIDSITSEEITNGYKYTINILSGATDTTGNIKLNANVMQDNNGNYNKESNISNNVNVILYKTFSLTYNSTNYEYHFDEGMTWTSFVNSSYNDGNFTISGENIKYYNNKVALNDTVVSSTATLSETTYQTKAIVYAWNKYTRSSVNKGSAAGEGFDVVIYDYQDGGYETNYVRYYSTPAYSEIVANGTTVSGSYYNGYTNFNALKGYYHIFSKVSDDPNSGWRSDIIRYIPSNATIQRKIDGDVYLVYFTYSYDVNKEYLTSEDSSAYPKNAWSGSTIYYEYLGEV